MKLINQHELVITDEKPELGLSEPWALRSGNVHLFHQLYSTEGHKTLHFSSGGGDADVTQYLCAYISAENRAARSTSLNHKVCASSAVAVFAMCNHRVAYRDATFSFHPIHATKSNVERRLASLVKYGDEFTANDLRSLAIDLRKEADELDKAAQHFDRHTLGTRAIYKNVGVPDTILDAATTRVVEMTAEEALSCGLIHLILERP